ncbi:type II 3-dehydroquinate dehydratase [Campylobacter hominis]|uniref:3-dehydroquinate dehydratase n=1 Tax=Campylobacter hominis (strain ATCC BAA-381 / DSM 21671 / CCUG 45161 / LMG 19568 / NCTC 13146 / CH001A) TaxID=360107 RepID=AROQ_CAMHC|nr:type II 3-dehydroquinate dehydratase [Campylobacter hominis]A7I2M4.1 RecName: Full=3-dehydroquinate dehydratase; Short=3-dehydroquinase; AltName: Full=Type II DHQase [Campylobacter hominis ATCC BAA-381]ABS52557.1 3-dehydroquinate dehydratase, type II [Campylobacter hominis ATCC BAA-381]UAK85987.1 type II 3-dehydroquinate dehydratase [Campylobacter hominis]SUW85284.1 3-dehydroquinate dehydratase, type II [Campylobacter hominis]
MKIMVIQGPNLNMLGMREPNIYGRMKLEDIHKQMQSVADQAGTEIEFFQSNFEGEIVDKIQECVGTADGIIINPAAYTHTSIAIHDAILAVSLPTIEVHISNPARREDYRKTSLIAPVTAGQIIGFGPIGYHLAMMGMLQIFEQIKAIKTANKGE